MKTATMLVAISVTMATAEAGNLITNPSFEEDGFPSTYTILANYPDRAVGLDSPPLTGWTNIGGADLFRHRDYYDTTFGDANDPNDRYMIGGSVRYYDGRPVSQKGISTVINTTPGATYELSFEHANWGVWDSNTDNYNIIRLGNGGWHVIAGSVRIGSTFNVDPVVTPSNLPPIPVQWHRSTFSFRAIDVTTEIKILVDAEIVPLDGYSNAASFIDNVRVVPEPATLIVLGVGLLFVRWSRRRFEYPLCRLCRSTPGGSLGSWSGP